MFVSCSPYCSRSLFYASKCEMCVDGVMLNEINENASEMIRSRICIITVMRIDDFNVNVHCGVYMNPFKPLNINNETMNIHNSENDFRFDVGFEIRTIGIPCTDLAERRYIETISSIFHYLHFEIMPNALFELRTKWKIELNL